MYLRRSQVTHIIVQSFGNGVSRPTQHTAPLSAAGPANRQQIKSRSGAVYVTQESEALQELACLSASLAHFITETSRRPHLVFLDPICKPVTLSLRGGVRSVSPPDFFILFFFPVEDLKGVQEYVSSAAKLTFRPSSQTPVQPLFPNQREQNVLVSSSIISF